MFACATVSLAELASANVVGYQANNVKEGYSILTPCFENIGADSQYPVDGLILSGVLDMEASVQVVNADGTWGTQGFWLNETTIDGVTYPAGWFTDASGATPADIALEPGQAVFFKTTALNAKVVIPSAL